ncbi:MAG TPA: hypothetical protein VFB34_06930 [Chloroflexota bacterium]|nr:hypothetical protein [Chloroflexota bacterium]
MTICADCGAKEGTTGQTRVEALPISPNLIWLATLLGGVLAAYAVALWNLRILKPKQMVRMGLIYAVAGIGGWIVTIIILANLTPPGGGQIGFGIPVALAFSFLLASIPYNRDSLAASQWIWSHPIRKLVFRIGGPSTGFGYVPFVSLEAGSLFGVTEETHPRLSIPIVPVALIVFSAAIGAVTILLGNTFAPR